MQILHLITVQVEISHQISQASPKEPINVLFICLILLVIIAGLKYGDPCSSNSCAKDIVTTAGVNALLLTAYGASQSYFLNGILEF